MQNAEQQDGLGAVVARVRAAVDMLQPNDSFQSIGRYEQFKPTRETWMWDRRIGVADLRTLLAAVDTRTRERDALREAVETKDRAHGMAVDREFAAVAQRDRYRAALVKYGTHDCDCTYRYGMNPELFPCNCGLSALLTEDA